MKRKFFVLTAIFLCAILFGACSVVESEPEAFLEDYKSVAYIIGASGNGTWIEKDGWINISPNGINENYVVTFSIENSGGYELSSVITYPAGCAFEEPSYTCFPNSLSISFSQSVLESIDGNPDANNISPTIELFRKDNNRPQNVYSLKMRCNTPPARIENAMSQMLSTSQQLVIAFDMPELAKDVNLLTIEANGTKHNFNIADGVPFAAGGETWIVSASAPVDMVSILYPDTAGTFATQGGTPYYITTDIAGLLSMPLFTVSLTLTDSGGLSSDPLEIPSRILKLGSPYSSSDGIENIAQDAGQDYGTFIIFPPDDHPEATVHYTVTSDASLVADVNGSTESHEGNTEFHLYPEVDGTAKTYTIERAYASLAGYLDSGDGAVAMGNSGVIKIEGTQLAAPTSNGMTFAQNEEGYAEYILTAESGATIFYTVKETGGSVIYNDSGTSPVTINLPSGEFDIQATAAKSFHKDSDQLNQGNVIVNATTMYVSASGSDTPFNGTKTNPCATIEYASGRMTMPGSDLNTVYLLSDLDATAPANFAPTAYTVKIIGCKDGTVGNAVTINCNTASSAFSVASGNDITLQNVNFAQSAGNTGSAISVAGGSLTLWNSTISGITADSANGGAVQVTSGTFTVKGKVIITGNASADVYLKDNQVINIDSTGIDDSLIGVKLQTQPTSSDPDVKITNGYGAKYGLNSPAKYFTSNGGGALIVNNGEAWISANAGGIGTNTPESLTFALSSTSGAGGAVTVSATGSGGAVTSGITWILILYFGSESTPIVSTTNTITIPANYQSGTYVIGITAVYNGTTYSDSLTYTKN